jgi:hypothetical protein
VLRKEGRSDVSTVTFVHSSLQSEVKWFWCAVCLALCISKHTNIIYYETILVQKTESMALGVRCACHATLSPQKLALTSPTCGGRSVGIVHSRTKANELLLSLGQP